MEIKKSNYSQLNEFISEINPNSNVKDIFTKINMFNVKKILKKNNNLDNTELYQFLTDNSMYKNTSIPIKKITNYNHKLFESIEIKNIINKNKNTAPGLNSISNKLLKMLPFYHIEKIRICSMKLGITQRVGTKYILNQYLNLIRTLI